MGQRPKKRSKKQPAPMVTNPLENVPPLPLTPDDLDALDDFCKTVDFEEIPIASWETCLSALEVRIPLWIDPAVALQGAAIPIKFSRRILNASESGILKEAVHIVLPVPAGTNHGSTIVWPGYGDKQDAAQGDLIVTIHVRSPRPPY